MDAGRWTNHVCSRQASKKPRELANSHRARGKTPAHHRLQDQSLEGLALPIGTPIAKYRGSSCILALPREVPQAFSHNDLCRLPTPYWLDPMPRVSSAVTNAPTALTSPTARGACLRRRPAQAYRRTDLCNKRRKLMEQWATYCCSPPAMAGKAVVPLVLDDSR